MLNSVYKDNKYTKWYFNIINNAQSQNRIKVSKDNILYNYYELHHIIPKSISFETSDLKINKENGVLLTPKEHFIVHCLLVKMCINEKHSIKMRWAFRFLKSKTKNHNNRYFTSNIYENNKKTLKHSQETIDKISIITKNNWVNGIFLNRPMMTEETKQKLRESTIKANMVGENHPFFGKKHKEESKLKSSLKLKGVLKSEETKIKMKLAWEKRRANNLLSRSI